MVLDGDKARSFVLAVEVSRLEQENNKLKNQLRDSFQGHLLDVVIPKLERENIELKELLWLAVEDLKWLNLNADDGCKLCKHNHDCKKEKCPGFISGTGAVNEKTGENYPDFKWSCMDFDFGTCDILQNTPCNECDFANHWQWQYADRMEKVMGNRKNKSGHDRPLRFI